ncbi:MAG: DMT family transporter [Armatimonadetes bacterium]|nr:DMT family transporter [Armatimonadota bacterium]
MSTRSVLGVIGVCVIWGLGFALMKVGLRYLPPFLYVGLRFAVSAACLFPLMQAMGVEWRVPPQARWRMAAIAGMLFLQQGAIFWGLTYTTAGRVGVILNTQPIITAVLAHWFIPGDRLTWGKVTGLLLAALGVFLIFRESFVGTNGAMRFGDLLALGAAVSWGAQNIVTKRTAGEVRPAAITAWSVVVSSTLLLTTSLLFEHRPLPLRPLDLPFVGATAYIIFVATVFGFVVWNYLLKGNNPSRVTSFCFITPVASVFFGWLVLDEAITRDIVLATALVGLGIFVANYPGPQSQG